MSEIWSNTGSPVHLCLRDEERTSSFHEAMRAVVRPGAVVLDVRAGSSILSLFAVGAGAGRVVATTPR